MDIIAVGGREYEVAEGNCDLCSTYLRDARAEFPDLKFWSDNCKHPVERAADPARLTAWESRVARLKKEQARPVLVIEADCCAFSFLCRECLLGAVVALDLFAKKQ